MLGLALFYGGIGQFAAGMWEFARGNTFGALAFTSFGAFWLSYWFLVDRRMHGGPHSSAADERDIGHALGLYLLVWAIFTAYMTIAQPPDVRSGGGGLRASTVDLRRSLCIGEFATKTGIWTKVGGWLGLLTAALAWYPPSPG